MQPNPIFFMFELKLLPLDRFCQVPWWASAWFSANWEKPGFFLQTHDLSEKPGFFPYVTGKTEVRTRTREICRVQKLRVYVYIIRVACIISCTSTCHSVTVFCRCYNVYSSMSLGSVNAECLPCRPCCQSHYTVLFSADAAVNPQDSDKVRIAIDYNWIWIFNLKARYIMTNKYQQCIMSWIIQN